MRNKAKNIDHARGVRYVKLLYKWIQKNGLTSPEFKILTALFLNTQKGYY